MDQLHRGHWGGPIRPLHPGDAVIHELLLLSEIFCGPPAGRISLALSQEIARLLGIGLHAAAKLGERLGSRKFTAFGVRAKRMSLVQAQCQALIARNSGNRTGDNGGNKEGGSLFAPVQMPCRNAQRVRVKGHRGRHPSPHLRRTPSSVSHPSGTGNSFNFATGRLLHSTRVRAAPMFSGQCR